MSLPSDASTAPRLAPGRAQSLFCVIRLRFKSLSFKWKRRITFLGPRATPQLTGRNKATEALILFAGTQPRVKERQGSWAQFDIISAQSANRSCPLLCGHLLTRHWIAATSLQEPREEAPQVSPERLRTPHLEAGGWVTAALTLPAVF